MSKYWWSERVEVASERKVRLFGAACCRLIWERLWDDRQRQAVEIVEQLADGEIDDAERSQAYLEVDKMLMRDRRGRPQAPTEHFPVIWALAGLLTDPAREGIEDVLRYTRDMNGQIRVYREIFGDPERPAHFCLDWRTDTAIALARQMYESREFSAMPILADALQDAGCDNDDILNHCRDTCLTHVRGCWVVDLVLGKV